LFSYSAAINRLSKKHLSLGRSILRLKSTRDELKERLTVLQHKCALIKQSVAISSSSQPKTIYSPSWNKALTPGSSSESATLVEDVSILERR
jgi:hypothetical protein